MSTCQARRAYAARRLTQDSCTAQRLPLPGSTSVRDLLLAAASRSPFACGDGTAEVVTMQGAALPDQRSLSGLLNAEEPPKLMVRAALSTRHPS